MIGKINQKYVDSAPKEICGASTIIDIYMDKKMFNEAKFIAERIVLFME